MLTPKERMLKRYGVEEMPKDPKERHELMRKIHRERIMEMRNKRNNKTE